MVFSSQKGLFVFLIIAHNFRVVKQNAKIFALRDFTLAAR